MVQGNSLRSSEIRQENRAVPCTISFTWERMEMFGPVTKGGVDHIAEQCSRRSTPTT